MLSAWWLHLRDGLGYYVIHPGKIEKALVIANNIMTLGYTYTKHRLNDLPDVFCKITHTDRLVPWIPSRLACTPALRRRDQTVHMSHSIHVVCQKEQSVGTD